MSIESLLSNNIVISEEMKVLLKCIISVINCEILMFVKSNKIIFEDCFVEILYGYYTFAIA